MNTVRLARLLLPFVLAWTFGCATRRAGAADTTAALREVGSVPLPGVEGRFDHVALDPDGKRLFVAALGNDTVEVIDLAPDPGRHAGSIKGLRKPAGVALVPDLKRVAVASGGEGKCRFFDAGTLAPAGEVGGLDDADNVRYDEAGKLLYVGYGVGAIAIIDPRAVRAVGDVKLAAHPESFRLESRGRRLLANLPEAKNAVAVVDREKRAVVATWRLKDAGANFPMWLDESHRRLFVGCRRPAKLLVLDSDSGATVASVDCVGDADDLFYDEAAKRIYVTGGDGAISVIDQVDADHYRPAGEVKTAAGARTSLFVPELHRLYVAVPHRGAQRAEVRVFETIGRDVPESK
jgi:DNA-binding beta-propeller fold protein YncE